jgi:hypothetical protein
MMVRIHTINLDSGIKIADRDATEEERRGQEISVMGRERWP